MEQQFSKAVGVTDLLVNMPLKAYTYHMCEKKKTIMCLMLILCFFLSGCNLTPQAGEKELSYREQGIELMQAAKYSEAAKMFQLALDQSMGFVTEVDIDICYYKAAALFASGDTEGAQQMYTNIIDFDGNAWKAYYLRGITRIQQQDTASATEDFDKAIAINPSDYNLYIEIYENLKSVDQNTAISYLSQAKGLESGNASSKCAYGYILYLLGEEEQSVSLLTEAVNEGEVRANYYLAEIRIMQGDYEAASALVDSGLASEDDTYAKELSWLRIVCDEYLGDFETAKTLIADYISAYPSDTAALRENTFLQTR